MIWSPGNLSLREKKPGPHRLDDPILIDTYHLELTSNIVTLKNLDTQVHFLAHQSHPAISARQWLSWISHPQPLGTMSLRGPCLLSTITTALSRGWASPTPSIMAWDCVRFPHPTKSPPFAPFGKNLNIYSQILSAHSSLRDSFIFLFLSDTSQRTLQPQMTSPIMFLNILPRARLSCEGSSCVTNHKKDSTQPVRLLHRAIEIANSGFLLRRIVIPRREHKLLCIEHFSRFLLKI